MHRILAAVLATLAFAVCGQDALAQTSPIYTIQSVTPTSVASGSGDTVFTTTGVQRTNSTRYNICYFTGSTSATIVPTAYNFNNVSAVTYTFTVPGTRFQTGGAAATPTIYAVAAGASNPTGCTGTNPGISNTATSSITAVNYSFRTATPSTIASGSANTSFNFTGSFPTFPANTSGLGLCFYNGTNSAPLLPSSQASTSNVTFLVPSATFASPASARLYLAPATSTCNGTNPGYGATFAYTITQGMRFTIQGAYPESVAAGGGNVAVSLYGNLQGTGIPNNGVCFYTGPNTTPTAITPTSFTTTEIDFVVPASALQIPPASFSSGTYNAQVQLGAAGGSCTTTAQGISNVYTLPIGYPTVSTATPSVLPQVNLNSTYTYLPANLELYGDNFGSKFSGRFIPAGGSQFETTGLQIDQNNAVVQLLRPSSNTATTAVYGCNYSLGNVYEYCGTTPLTLTNYALATSATQIAASPASPAPGSAVTLTASITPGAGSTTAAGTFVPGPPSGTVSFSDSGTSLGTATLAGGALRLAPTGTQTINIYAGTDAIGFPISDESQQPGVTAAAIPNETPSPDINSQFSSLMADFNKDGINDTLLIQSATGILHLFLGGSPLGTIQSEQTIYPSNYYCSSLSGVTVADFNGDGFPDIAFLCGDSGGYSNLQVLLNKGDGSFPYAPTNVGYVSGNQLAAGDVNKDGKIDLVVTGNTGSFCCTGQTFGIQVYTGDGTGNFTSGTLTPTADIPGAQVVLRDLNNDGAADLVFLHYDATGQKTEVALWQNDGTGRFTRLTALPVCNCQVTKSKLFVTPLTTSSLYPDIVVDYFEGSNILAFVNRKTATIGFTTVAPTLYSNLTDVVLGDFNGDGFTDFAHYNSTNITIELGNGTGTFALNNAAFAPYTVGAGSANLVSLATSPDLNGDGYADLIAIFPNATTNPSSSTIASYVTTGTAVATLPTTLNTGGSRTITTVYTGNRNVLGSNGSQAITVGRAAPTITWNPATTTNTTTPLGNTILNATASVPGAFAYTPAAGSYLAAGTQTITAVFTPTDSNTYSAVTTTRNVTVSKTTPTITTTINPGNHTYTPNLATTYSAFVTGANIVPTGNVQFNANGSPTGSLAGLSQSGTAQSSTQILFGSLPAGTFAFTAAYAGDAVYNAVTSAVTNYIVSQSTPTLTYTPTPTAITYGTGLVAAQLNATAVDPNTGASIPGTVTYSTPGFTSLQTGSVLPAGSNVITASLAPTDSQDYASVSRTATITVAVASTTTAVTVSPNAITPGQSVLLSVNVTPNPNGSAVTGVVTFSDDNGTIPNAQVTLSNGTATRNYTPSATGTHRISAAYAGTVNYSPSSSATPATFSVSKKTPALTYAPTPGTIQYGTGIVASQLNATAIDSATGAAVPGTFTYSSASFPTLQTGAVLPAGTNIVTASFTPTDTANYSGVSNTASIVVTQFTPVIVWATPASIPYGTALSATQLNAVANDINGAAIPGTYSYNPAAGTVPPAGTTQDTVTFTPTNTTNFATATATRTITVTAGTTTTSINLNPGTIALGQSTTIGISVTPAVGSNMVFGQVTVTDNRGTITPAQVSLAYGVASISYTPTTVGVHTINVSYPGNSTYAASSNSAPLTVTQGTPVITFAPNPATIPYGTPLSAAQLNAAQTTSIPGAFSYSSPLGTVLPVGANTLTATFTPTDTVNYATVTRTATVTVTQFSPIIVWATPASIPFGTPLSSTQLNAVANDINGAAIPGTYSYSPATGTVLPVGDTQDTVTFTPTNTTNFATASATRTITVTSASTTTTLSVNPASISLGQSVTLTATVTPATGSGPATGTVTFSDNSGTISPNQATLSNGVATLSYTPTTSGTHLISASYTGVAPYGSSTTATPATLTVGKGNPVITFAPNPATIPYGTPLSAAQLNAAQTGSIPGVFSYSSPLGTVLPVGANTITATFTPTDTTTYNTVTRTATVTVTQFTPVITWAASTISYGTALSSTQLNAVANDVNGTAIPGTYSYSPAAGTILPVGANQVTVTFTPTNTTNFATATATRTITVIRTATVTTLSINPTTIALGQPSAITATVTPTSGAGPVIGQVSFTDSLGTISPAQVTLVNGVATFSYTPTAIGTHVITVSFPNTTNNSASSAGGNLIVGRGVPVINFTPNPATIPYGTPLSAAQLNAVETTGNILGSFSYSSPLGTVLNTGANTITATFTPTDTANYSTVTKTAIVTVTQFTPVIAWTTPAAIPFGTALSSTQLNAVANDLNGAAVPGTYSYTPAAGTVLPLGTTQDTLTFTPTNTQNFATATATRAITVVAASTATALNINPATITLGQATTLTATVAPTVGTATVTGSVTFTDSRGAITSSTVTLSNGVATLSYTPTANGSHTITAAYSGSTNYAASSGVGTLAVGQGLPVITFAPNPSTIVYGTPLSAAQLNAVQTTSIPGAFSYSSPLGTILPVGANVITATFTPTDTTSFATVTKTATVTVTQAIPTITWNPPASTLANIPLDTTILNATASVPGTFAYTPAAGSYLNFGTATLNLLFTPTDNTNYQTASATRTIAVGKANPTPILLTASPASQTAPNLPVVFTVSIPGTNITPTGIVRLFESTTLLGSGSVTQATGHNGIASITVSTLASGVHSIVANIAADAIYNEATSAPLAYNVGGATVPITFAPNPATIPYGTPLSAAQLNATSTIPGTFAYSPALNSILDAGVNTITATFTPTDTATYATTVKTATVTVTQFTPVIAWATPNAIPFGTPLSATQLNAVARDLNGATVPGTYSYNPAAGTVLPVGTTQDTVAFTPTNTQNFAAATGSVPISVTPGATTTTLGINPGSISLGQSVTLTATVAPVLGTAPITGSVIFTDSRETIPSGTVTLANGVAILTYTPTANGTHAITASFPGNTTYSPSFAVSTLAVGQGLPVITFAPNPATIPYGTPLSAAQLNAVQTTSIPGAFSYSSPLGTVLPVGANTITATFTPTDTATYATVTKTATVTVTQFAPVIAWATPAAITFGTPLSATQLNAVANDISGVAIPGTYAYAPPAGTVLPVGTTQETLTFTPTNTTNFATATATRAITVNSAPTTNVLTLSANPITVGQSVTLTSTLTSLAGTPTGGNVTFFQTSPNQGSGTIVATVPLVNGVATTLFTPPTAATYTLFSAYTNSPTFGSSNAQTTLVVSPATVPILTWNPSPSTIPYGTVLSASQLNAFEASNIPGLISYSSPLGTVLPVGANVLTATFTPTDTVRYTTVTKTATITVTQFTPIILWSTPAAIPNGTPLSATQLNAIARDVNGINIPGTYTYNPPAGTVLPLGITQDTVTFTPTDTLNFATATATVPINVILLPTTTTLVVSPNPIALGQSVTLTATVSPAAAPGAIQFADNSGTITPSQVTLVNGIATVTYTPTTAGTHLITASYLGATSYASSSATPVSLVVGQGAPVITFTPNPATIPFGTPLSAAQLNATSTLPGTFSYSQPLGTILDAGVYTLTATFTPTDTASYSTVTKTATVTVTRFTPVITWPFAQVPYGRPLSATQLNATAADINGTAVPGTYTYNPALGALLPVGDNPASVTFTPTNAVNFNAATATNTIRVNRQQTNIAVAVSPGSITLGQSITATVTVTSTLNGTPTGTVTLQDFAVNPNVVATAPLNNGVATFTYTPQTVGSHSFGASYSGDTNYEITLTLTSTPSSVTVTAPTPTITWQPSSTTVGTTLSAAQLNAVATDPSTGATVPGTFVYTPAAGSPVSQAGTQTLSVRFTPNDLTKYSATTATAPLTVARGTPVLNWPTPAPINQGTPLSAAQLNAVVVPGQYDLGLTLAGGTYTYTPAAGTILPPGVQTLSVTFTPGDAADYNTGTQTVQLTVLNAVTATLLTSSVNPSVFGQPVVLTTTITQAGTLTTPVTGTVTFYEGDTPLAEPLPVTANTAGATATLTLSNLATGLHQLTAIYSGDANYLTGTTLPLTQTVTIAPVTLNWAPAVTTIPYGTALTAAQLNATPVSPYVSNVTGLLTYAPPAGTILQAGSQTLTATFTPTDTTNFLPAAGSTVVNVTQLTPTIAWAAPASIMQGAPLSASQLNATATGLNGVSLPGTFTYTPAAGATLPVGTTTLRVLFTPADLTDYTTATASVPLTVTSADTTTTLTLSSNSIALGQAVTLTARVAPVAGTGTPAGQVQFTDSTGTITPATATLANGVATVTYTPTTAGTHLLTAAFLGTTTYNASSTLTPAPLAVGQSTPSLTWTPTPLTLGTALGAAQLNAVATDVNGATLPGTYVYTPAAGAILPVGTQPLSVTFTPTDRANYTTATLATTVLVRALSTATALTSSANPAAFSAPINLIATITPIGGTSTTPIAGSVTFLEGTTQLGTAQAANGTATLAISTLGVGNHPLTAVFSGDTPGNYLTSTSTILTQVINTSTPVINWTPNPATIVYGTRLTAAQLNAVARTATGVTLPGTFTYNPAAGTVLPAGTQTLNVSFTPDDTIRYATTTATVVLTVTRATPTIVWNTPAAINQGTPLSATQLNAAATGIGGAALPGTFTYNPAAGAILTAGTQTLNVTFTPTDAANYLTATAAVALTVLNPTTGTVLTSSVNPSQFGQPTVLTATIAIPVRGSTAPSGNVTFFDGDTQIGDPTPITVTSTGATATLTVATLGTGSHQLTAAYANDPNYVASTSLPLAQTVTIAPVTLAWTPTVATIPYGTPLTAAQLNAVPVSPFVPNVNGLLTYTPAAGTILSAGTQTLTASFTPTDTADFLSAAGSTVITVTQATPTIAWPTPAAIAQGTALSATQLNATATGINNQILPGTFTYTPAAGTVLQAGTTTLRVLFTPTDTVNYTTATATVPLNVSIPSTTTTLTSSLNPSQSGQSIIFTATVAQTGTSTQPLTGTVTFFDGTATLGTSPLTAGSATFTTSALSVATHTIRATYTGTADFATSTSSTLAQAVTAAATRLTWTPNPASIVYGTPLSAAQLNAVASSITATTVPGAYTYTPIAGTVLSAGTQTLSVTFTPTDTVNFTAATATTSITITKATPTVTFPTPAPVAVGTALSTTQLAATATGITGAALSGTFTYTPAAGTLVVSGPQTLSVTFTPTDTANYNNATATTTLNGTATTLTALSATTAFLGDPAKTLTLTGTGFVSDSVARANGIALATTYVSPTTLNATLPPTTFRTVQTLQVTVNNPTQRQTTSALPFTVNAPAVVVKVNAPSTANPGDQPTITSALAAAYPVDVTGTFTLTFQPISGGVVDPAIQFATGGTTSAFTIAAGQTNNPNLQIQTGTVAGTITVRLTLAAGGADVTPTGLAPLVINVPTVSPTITSVTLTRSGRQLTVRTLGFSNTREVTKATFHFVPATGQQIQTQDVTVDVGSIFAGWYSQSASTAYGSTFLYTQTFTLDDDATVVGQVTVTLGNSVGASASGSSQ